MAAETLTDLVHTQGYVRVQWTNAGVGASFYAMRLYRRLPGEAWELLFQTTSNQSNYTYDDWRAPVNVPVEYDVVRVNSVGGVLSEETKTPSTITPLGSDYWLIHPSLAAFNLRLAHVTEDSFKDEVEQEVMHLLGRGRKTDYGDVLGVDGSITADLRDISGGLTGRAQQILLRSLYRERTHVYLRNPFGDVYKIKLGEPDFSRTPGMGLRDFTSVTFTYQEVA
jgi:hypothetical protein